MTAPVLQNFTQRRGALTLLSAGAVALAGLMQTGGETPTSWTLTQTGGVAGHWTLPTDGTSPAPTSTGVSAQLNGGPYTFSVVAHGPSGDSAAKTLTINIDANTYTVASPAQFTALQTGSGIRAGLAGKTIAIARGSTAAFANGAAITVKTFNLHGSTRFTVTSEDPTPGNRSVISALSFSSGNGYINFTALEFERHIAAHGPDVGAAPDGGAGQNVYMVTMAAGSANIAFYDLDMGADPSADSPSQWVGAFSITGLKTSPYTPITGIEIYDVRMSRINQGIVLTNVADSHFYSSTPNSSPWLTVDRFCGNTWFVQSCNNLTLEDFVFCRPFRNRANPDDHIDFCQWSAFLAGSPANVVQDENGNTVRRGAFLMADGNADAQGPFSRGTAQSASSQTTPPYKATGFKMNNTTWQNLFTESAVTQGASMDGGDGWLVDRMTIIKGENRNRQDVHEPNSDGTLFASTTLFVPSIFPTETAHNLSVFPSGSITNCIVQHFGQQAQMQPHFTPDIFDPANPAKNAVLDNLVAEPAAISSALSTDANETARAAYYSQGGTWFQNPNCADIDYAALTAVQIFNLYRLRYAPALNGAFKNADGTYRGCWFPDGSWNDGSVYGQASATSYGVSQSLSEAAAGQPVSFTIQLNGPAAADITFTPHVAGVIAGFSPDPLVIPAGQSSGATSMVAASAGTASVTFTNTAGFSNPAAAPVIIDPLVVAPTAVSQHPASTRVLLGVALQVTYTLDAPALADVTLTPSADVAGSWSSPTVTIPAGQTLATALFIASALGAGHLSVANDAGLANPAPVAFVVTRMTRGQLRLLRIA